MIQILQPKFAMNFGKEILLIFYLRFTNRKSPLDFQLFQILLKKKKL